jgi:hypothetical protein
VLLSELSLISVMQDKTVFGVCFGRCHSFPARAYNASSCCADTACWAVDVRRAGECVGLGLGRRAVAIECRHRCLGHVGKELLITNGDYLQCMDLYRDRSLAGEQSIVTSTLKHALYMINRSGPATKGQS